MGWKNDTLLNYKSITEKGKDMREKTAFCVRESQISTAS